MKELENIVSEAISKTKSIESKLERDKKEVYYIDNSLCDPMQENPLNHPYAIKVEGLEKFVSFYIVEWDIRFPYWVFYDTEHNEERAVKRVKELNKEHEQLTSK